MAENMEVLKKVKNYLCYERESIRVCVCEELLCSDICSGGSRILDDDED